MQLRLYQSHGCDYLYFYHVQTFNDHFVMCSRDMLSHKRIIRTRIIIFCALVLLQNVFLCELQDCLLVKMHNRILCTCMAFLQCERGCASSEFLLG